MSEILREARRVFEIEAKAILGMRERVNGSFENAVRLILACRGKVIVTGIGKSGQVARKIASTLSSTGTPAVFLHPAESSHGDMGMIGTEDVVIALSYRGETQELTDLMGFVARRGVKLISFTSGKDSTLAKSSDQVLDVSVSEEACPLGLAPTASTTAMLAMGDALAVVLLKERGFKAEDFAEFHPGGALGRRLLTRVKDLMHTEGAFATAPVETSLRKVITKMTSGKVRGTIVITDAKGDMQGVITDGDVRRYLEKGTPNPLEDRAELIMGRQPKTVDLNEMAERATFMMEQFAIQALVVLDHSGSAPKKAVGIVTMQDLLRARIR